MTPFPLPSSRVVRAESPDHFTGWPEYTDADHDTWRRLFVQQMPEIRAHAETSHYFGVQRLKLSCDEVPDPPLLSKRLRRLAGWTLHPVPGMASDYELMSCLANKEFPVNPKLRDGKNLAYSPEPDLFHDVFGHVPMLMVEEIRDALHTIGCVAVSSPHAQNYAVRLYFWATEFGLLKHNNELDFVGAGIASSLRECTESLRCPTKLRVRFDPIRVMRTPVFNGDVQRMYFVLGSLHELTEAVDLLKRVAKDGEKMGDLPNDRLVTGDEVYTS